MMPPFMGSFAVKLIAIVVMELSVFFVGAYAGYRWESSQYFKFKSEVSERDAKARSADLAARAVFDAKLAAANERAAAMQAQLNALRAKQDQALTDAMTKEGQKDASLNACLVRKLPDSILRQLAR